MFQIFVCAEVSGKSYLRCDYSLECYTGVWKAYAAYCCLWIIVYTVGFPVWMWMFLHRNQEQIKEHYSDQLHPLYKVLTYAYLHIANYSAYRCLFRTSGSSGMYVSRFINLFFLLTFRIIIGGNIAQDYCPDYYWWECVELVRKLVLSSCLLLFDQSNPWQGAYLVYSNCAGHQSDRS